jgi:hypothetical protein
MGLSIADMQQRAALWKSEDGIDIKPAEAKED